MILQTFFIRILYCKILIFGFSFTGKLRIRSVYVNHLQDGGFVHSKNRKHMSRYCKKVNYEIVTSNRFDGLRDLDDSGLFSDQV